MTSGPSTLTGVRTAFGLAERYAPRAAGHLAGALFTRIPPVPPRERRHRNFPAGERVRVAVGGRAVVAERWGEGPVVQLVHGWGGWRQQFGSLVQPLVDRGMTVVSHDALSHGDSAAGTLGSGRTTMLELADTLVAVAQAVDRTIGPTCAVVAHSGAALATLWAMRLPDSPLRPARLALIAPSVRLDDVVGGFGARFGVGPRGIGAMVDQFERRYDFRLADLDALTATAALADRPELLVVHDHDDAETPWQGSADLVAAWPGARLLSTTGLGHHKVIWDPGTTSAVTDFLAAT